MAAPDDAFLKNIINSNLVDSPPGQPRRNTATTLRAVIFALIDWVKSAVTGATYSWLRTTDGQPSGNQADTIYHIGKVVAGRTTENGTGAQLQAPEAWFDTINGQPAGGLFSLTSGADAINIRYYPICQLPATTGGTYDFADITLTAKPWDNASGSHIHINLYVANRGGFTYQYTTQGFGYAVGIVAYQQADNSTIIYARTDNTFQALAFKVIRHAQATVFPSITTILAPPGTLVFNSLDMANYSPLMALDSRFTSFIAGNGDGSFPLNPLATPGTGQLSLAANWIPGSSDLALISSNIAGNGFTFWQLTAAAAKRRLAWLTGNGDFILGAGNAAERLTVEGNAYLTGVLRFPSVINSRKIVLYGSATGTDMQFYGFGVDGGTLRYQVNSVSDSHIFYAGLSPVTSREIMRVQGDGKVGINRPNPVCRFEVGDSPTDGVLAQFINMQSAGGGGFIRLSQTDAGFWDVGPTNTNSFIIRGWNGAGALVERVRIEGANGSMGIGTTGPTSRLHINGATGHQQLRLEQAYTPTGTGDPNGQTGQIAWDQNFFYVKVAGGWRRSALQSF
ncbi:hypothetical protein [Spirosoma spitsbergense]|uniref:hypothetical protein n=1 Tax=Spirosoma spitsbergense TaxID=431554 RepID=UPI000377C3B6|nr:hypothetical protein [Spirosoma spitsbergense]